MASLFLRFPQGRSKAFTLSYDDGLESDVRLVQMLRERGMKGTFNLNSEVTAPEGYTYPPDTPVRLLTRSVRRHAFDGMEAAVHGAGHSFLEQLPQAVCTAEILRDRLTLERELGCIVRGMAYPYGTFSPLVLESAKACGISYARTVRSTHDFLMPANWLLWDPTCHHGDEQLFTLAGQFLAGEFTGGDRRPRLFYVWGHTFELEREHNWDRMEKLLDTMAGHQEVWYATNGEIRDYAAAFDALVFSADAHLVYNPSARPVWLEYGLRLFEVAPGETKELY